MYLTMDIFPDMFFFFSVLLLTSGMSGFSFVF